MKGKILSTTVAVFRDERVKKEAFQVKIQGDPLKNVTRKSASNFYMFSANYFIFGAHSLPFEHDPSTKLPSCRSNSPTFMFSLKCVPNDPHGVAGTLAAFFSLIYSLACLKSMSESCPDMAMDAGIRCQVFRDIMVQLQGLHSVIVRQTFVFCHEPTFFYSSLAKSKPTWWHHEVLQIKASKK